MENLPLSEVILGIVTSVVLLLLTIVLAAKRPLQKHNVALAFLFTCGLCHASSYFILLREPDKYPPCKVDALSYYSFFLMRLSVMIIYYLRIDPLIGGKVMVYPVWLRWLCIPTVLSTFVAPTILRLSLGEDIDTCSNNFFYILVFTRIIPSFIFLGFFLAPLSRSGDPVFRRVMWKQACIFIFDVCIECAFLVTVSDWSSDGSFVQIDASSMILQQIILVLMFSDAKVFYCPCIDFADKGFKVSVDECCEEHTYSPLAGESPEDKSPYKHLLDIYRPDASWSWSLSSVGPCSHDHSQGSMLSDLERTRKKSNAKIYN